MQSSSRPSAQPSSEPSESPLTSKPTLDGDTNPPTGVPSAAPSARPSWTPTTMPSGQPSATPTKAPVTSRPTVDGETHSPSNLPSAHPSGQPSARPSGQPTAVPSRQPSSVPTSQPSGHPSGKPSAQPIMKLSTRPTGQPSSAPSSIPTSAVVLEAKFELTQEFKTSLKAAEFLENDQAMLTFKKHIALRLNRPAKKITITRIYYLNASNRRYLCSLQSAGDGIVVEYELLITIADESEGTLESVYDDVTDKLTDGTFLASLGVVINEVLDTGMVEVVTPNIPPYDYASVELVYDHTPQPSEAPTQASPDKTTRGFFDIETSSGKFMLALWGRYWRSFDCHAVQSIYSWQF